jgi:hypothetical protein
MSFELTTLRIVLLTALLLNVFIGVMYFKELQEYYLDSAKYNPDAIRFFVKFIIYDLFYLGILIFLLAKRHYRLFWVVLTIAFVQNINLGNIDSLPVTGFIISLVSLITFFILLIKFQ